MSTERRRIPTGSLKRLAIWLLILAIWEGAYRLVHAINPPLWQPWNFPPPSMVIQALWAMLKPVSSANSQHFHWYSSQLLLANVVSLIRLVIGFLVSILIGGIVGLAMWRWPALDQFLGPPLLGVQTLPSVCWVPMAVLVLGLEERAILFVTVMGSFAAIAISLRDGLRMIPPLFPRAGLMLGARGWRLYRYVLLPASLPALATSLRQGFSFAWRSLMGAELILFIAAPPNGIPHNGLGYLLQTGRDFSRIEDVIGVMIVMVLIGMLADRWVFAKIQARVQARFGLG